MGSTMIKSRSLRAVAVATAAASVLVLGAGVASAGTFSNDYSTAANIRSGPTTSYGVLGVGYPGQGNTDYCFTNQGTGVNGDYAWDKNRDSATGVTGWTSEEYLTSHAQETNC
ncbi:hypothetical protein OG455_05900 [Kitasatospora sp. NBC_01287]|uniref:hypothetical protein n=1 Tax=Kitasatospora sp. NBC_01287 TaxID=2903573 RepID=UPI0022528E10|nr:hypothetical protein [Kitasatospora sp. NBC_01287]MCX4745061.1 hypothetical protein [Kitasatospora sp. NBC_01287]